MSSISIERTVGKLEAGQHATNARLDSMEKTLAGQDAKLDKLLAIHNQRKGAQAAMKIFMTLGGSSGFAAGLGVLWEHFGK